MAVELRARRILRERALWYVLGGCVSLCLWLMTLRVNGYWVLRSLERFAAFDDGRYLLASAGGLVLLNTLRATPLYLGWFLIGEGVSYTRSGKSASWLIPLVAVPLTYELLARTTGGLVLHFGPPALFCLLSFCLIHFSTMEIRSWLSRMLVLSLLVFAFQWLDIAPSLTRWGFGRGEFSLAVKLMSTIDDWDWVMDSLSFILFLTAFAGGIVAAVLLVGINKLNAQHRKLRERERKLALMREEAVATRGYREIQQLVHDLRRPLTTVLGLADVLAETLPSGPELEYAERIVGMGGSMDRMIEELLKEDAKQPVVVSDLVEYIKSQISAYEWRHIVETVVEESVASCCLPVNRVRLSRAVVNLLENARMAVSNEPAPVISFSVLDGGDELLFRVEDNGRGFSRKRLAQWGESEWGSTGIGLAFVSEVAKKHGGSLAIVNTQAGGAAATISVSKT